LEVTPLVNSKANADMQALTLETPSLSELRKAAER
jgi:hypothetical protein